MSPSMLLSVHRGVHICALVHMACASLDGGVEGGGGLSFPDKQPQALRVKIAEE